MSAAAPTASSSAFHSNALKLAVVNVCAISSASAGKIGTMYEGSLEPEAEKNIKISTAHSTRKRCGWNAPRSCVSCQPLNSARGRWMIHGSMASTSIGRKYHQPPSRRCTLLAKRAKCSRMKKKSKNSGLACCTSTNHGAAIAKKTSSPQPQRSRVSSRQSRCTMT